MKTYIGQSNLHCFKAILSKNAVKKGYIVIY